VPPAPTSDPALPDTSEPAIEDDVLVDTSGGGLFEDGLFAAPDEAIEGEPAPDQRRGYTLNGYMRGDMFVGKVPGFRTGVLKAGYGELALKLAATRQTYGDAFAEARLQYGLMGAEQRLSVD
jgi:hypothetical protein